MRTNLTLAQPSGVWTNTFFYCVLERITNVTSAAGSFTYHYSDPSDRLTSMGLPNGASIGNSFDNLSRLTTSYLYSSQPAVLDAHLLQL